MQRPACGVPKRAVMALVLCLLLQVSHHGASLMHCINMQSSSLFVHWLCCRPFQMPCLYAIVYIAHTVGLLPAEMLCSERLQALLLQSGRGVLAI